jgi:hypothetical protein
MVFFCASVRTCPPRRICFHTPQGNSSAVQMGGLHKQTASSAARQLHLSESREALLAQNGADHRWNRAVTIIQAFSRRRAAFLLFRAHWKRATKVAKTTGMLLASVRIRRMAELPLAISGTVLSVESRAELEQLRLWEQGDVAMYERKALEARYSNRNDKQVWQYLNIWWQTSMGSAGLPERSSMPKQVYVQMYLAVCKALLEDGEQWDEAEATRLVEEAWAEDSRGSGRLTRTMFNDALFECAPRPPPASDGALVCTAQILL